jgi:cardiolipin synthase (CMP-forming)
MGGAVPGPASPSERVVTLPNALSLVRLLGVPVFFWLVLTHHDGAAVLLLGFSGATDYLDGKIARAWNQMSRLGALLDPAADRLYILATLIGLTVRDVVPVWLTLAIVGRDLLLAATLPLLSRRGYGPLPVHYLGKAATFCLLFGFPLLLLGEWTNTIGSIAHVLGWAFAIWGTALYWWAGVLYLVQVRGLLRAQPEEVVA